MAKFSVGSASIIIAITPATCGAAIEVPEMVEYQGALLLFGTAVEARPFRAREAVMSTPGAVMSGPTTTVLLAAPRDEKLASWN